MDKTLQTKAWNCLPKEFKEEVKKEWKLTDNIERLPHDAFLRGKCQMMRDLFGHHNLNSDAERDEMLTVSHKKVQEFYAKCKEVTKNPYSYPDYSQESALSRMALLDILFGSKCLPDACNVASTETKPAKPKFKVGDRVITPERGKNMPLTIRCKTGKHYYAFEEIDYDIHEDYLEPYTEQEENVNLSQNIANCDKCPKFVQKTQPDFGHSRLNIAAMAMQGILANPNTDTEFVRATGWNHINCGKEEYIASKALRYADAIMNQAGE